jgi:arsenate reductase
MITVYGLKNCDTTRKALKWLEARGTPHRFCDVRADGIDLVKVTAWADAVGWQTLLNTRGTTWRGLPEPVRAATGDDTAAALMVDHPALIKRPVIETARGLIVGFKTEQVKALEAAL